MAARKIMMLVILGACAVTVAAQEKHRGTVNADGEMIPPQGMEEYLRRRQALLKNPDFLKLELAPADSKDEGESLKEPRPFRVGEKIRFELRMTNTVSEPFVIVPGAEYHNTRPSLIRDGQTVPYHEEAIRRVENKEKIYNLIHAPSTTLRPGKTQSVGIVDLSRWYEPLEPGRYLMTVQYRIRGSEKWIESPPMTFEVVPSETQ